jgi:starch synthase
MVLKGFCKKRQKEGRLTGIINGIDEAVWNPATDDLIVEHYSAQKRSVGRKTSE